MISKMENVKILAAMLKAYKIKNVVLSPGNRNLPLVNMLETDSYFKCYSVVDERSAGFFAVGLIERLQEPVAVCCTSGTAVCDYSSAVAEAYYQELPLVVLTADRCRYYLNQREAQMIPQRSVLKDITKSSVQLPIICRQKEVWYCKNQIHTALLELDHHGKGPVHINFEIEEGLGAYCDNEREELPAIAPMKRLMYGRDKEEWCSKAEILAGAKKVLVIYGQSAPCNDYLSKQIEKFSDKYNVTVCKDHLSNLHTKKSLNVFTIMNILSGDIKKSLQPDLVIMVNGNYVFNIDRLLGGYKGKFWLVSESGKVQDPLRCLTDIFECRAQEFFEYFNENGNEKNSAADYFEQFRLAAANVTVPDVPYSDIYAAKEFLAALPQKCLLHLANSSSVRIANLFPLNKNIEVYCNRGTNGIDGSLSALIGQANAYDGLAFLLIGDLSFFYDMNGLWNNFVGNNVRILLNNNEGAAIFHYSYGENKIKTINQHIAAEHFSTAKGWVESRGFTYLSARNEDEFKRNLKIFVSEKQTDRPIFFEVFTKKDEDASLLHSCYDSNKDQSLKAKAKRLVGSVLSPEQVSKVKKFLK